jgi:hypothetical protein
MIRNPSSKSAVLNTGTEQVQRAVDCSSHSERGTFCIARLVHDSLMNQGADEEDAITTCTHEYEELMSG